MSILKYIPSDGKPADSHGKPADPHGKPYKKEPKVGKEEDANELDHVAEPKHNKKLLEKEKELLKLSFSDRIFVKVLQIFLYDL